MDNALLIVIFIALIIYCCLLVRALKNEIAYYIAKAKKREGV